MRVLRRLGVRRPGVRLVMACAFVCAPATLSIAQELPQEVEGAQRARLPVVWSAPDASAPASAGIPEAPRARRPGALVPLYAGLVTLQALDIHSTYSALSRGGTHEANPVMAPLVKNRAAFTVVKASSTAGLVWATERMWKKNRKAAVIFAVAANTGMALVVSHNYRVAARRR